VDLQDHFSTSLHVTRLWRDTMYAHSQEGATALIRDTTIVLVLSARLLLLLLFDTQSK